MKKMSKTPYAFIPKHLEIENRPDLGVFPNKIVYMSYRLDHDGNRICGSSQYAPVLKTLKQAEDCWELRYQNEYGENSWLRIIYYPDSGKRIGEKYVREKLVGITVGEADWKEFFIQLTMTGLQNDEDCVYRRPQSNATTKRTEDQRLH